MDQIAELMRNKNVVAVIAFRESNIYATDAVPGERSRRIAATDPCGRFHKVGHHAGNPSVGPTRMTLWSTGRRSPRQWLPPVQFSCSVMAEAEPTRRITG